MNTVCLAESFKKIIENTISTKSIVESTCIFINKMLYVNIPKTYTYIPHVIILDFFK